MPKQRKNPKWAKRKCESKQAFASKGDAVAAARAMHRKTGSWFSVYRCSVGPKGSRRHWHIGHARRARKPGRAW